MPWARDSVRGSPSSETAVTPPLREVAGQVRVGERGQHADDGLPGVQPRKRGRVRAGHREDDVRGRVQVVGAGDGRPGRGVGAVGKPGAVPGARLDKHLETRLDKPRHGLRHQGDAPFSRRALLYDSHLHGRDLGIMTPLLASARLRLVILRL